MTVVDWSWRRSWKGTLNGRLPRGARRVCQRCRVNTFKAAHGRRFCGGCSKNVHTRHRWLEAGKKETY